MNRNTSDVERRLADTLTVGLTDPAATVNGGVTLPVDLNKNVKVPTT